MQLIREKEKLYFIAKNEAEAVEAEAILTPLLKRFLPDKDAVEQRIQDLKRFDELTKNFTESVPQYEIDKLADEVDTLMWEDYKAKRNL
jgi:hypothetical protein